MRRKDREVKDIYGIREIIRECDCCRLAFPHGKSAYIVPLSFGYNEEENAFYFHGAAEGKKMDLVRTAGLTRRLCLREPLYCAWMWNRCQGKSRFKGSNEGGRICLSQDAESAAINVKERKRSAVRDV